MIGPKRKGFLANWRWICNYWDEGAYLFLLFLFWGFLDGVYIVFCGVVDDDELGLFEPGADFLAQGSIYIIE